jgi:hypothetical protein
LKNSIVVYSEIIDGNPLFSQNVVRWFLHKPGYHTGEINYGKNELYFFYHEFFNDPIINDQVDNQLMVSIIFDDIYKQTNFGDRKGSCYILRKGKNREIVHDISDSILIDGLSHQEISKIFNQVEFCISYDTYTLYSAYAVMCGCKSIVIPEDGVSKEEWEPIEEMRYGIAYGFDDIENAEKTKEKLLPYLKEEEEKANKSVEKFIEKCEAYFR